MTIYYFYDFLKKLLTLLFCGGIVVIVRLTAPLAQLVEHLTLNQGVQGSNPWRCI